MAVDSPQDFQVSNATRARTSECWFAFKCLEAPDRHPCPPYQLLKGNGLFLKTLRRESCAYMMSFGYSYICHCPTRCELYERYRK